MGHQIRIQAIQNCPPSKKEEKMKKFLFEEFSVGLEASPEPERPLYEVLFL
jgi:hypothetical protein